MDAAEWQASTWNYIGHPCHVDVSRLQLLGCAPVGPSDVAHCSLTWSQGRQWQRQQTQRRQRRRQQKPAQQPRPPGLGWWMAQGQGRSRRAATARVPPPRPAPWALVARQSQKAARCHVRCPATRFFIRPQPCLLFLFVYSSCTKYTT